MFLSTLLQPPRALVSRVLPLAVALSIVPATAARAAITFTYSNTTATVALNRTVTASTTIKASVAGTSVQYASVCARDAAGNNVDFPMLQNVQIDSVNGTTITRSRTLPPGTYTYFGCVKYDNGWYNSGSKTLVVPSTPSGQPMPVGDVVSNGVTWRQVTAEDFNTPAAIGAFPSVYRSVYDAYPDYSGNGKYVASRTLSAHDGVMDVWLHNEGGQDMGVGGVFRVNGSYRSTYGRYSVRFKADSTMPGYGGVFQLWPSSEVWAEGEMDFPEGSYSGSLNLYHHRVGSNPEQNYLVKEGLGTWTTWHTATIEWLPGSVTYYLDGVVVAKVTDPAHVASTPHNWVFQTASHSGGDVPNSVQGHLLIDWVVAYLR